MNATNIIALAISFCLEIWLLILLFRRGARAHFPIFFAYVLISAPVSAARMLTAGHYQTYFYVYWASTALLMMVGLAAVHEVFRWVYEGFYEFVWFRLLYYGAIATVLVVTVRNAIVNPPVQAHPVIGTILDLSIATNLLRAGIACLFYALLRPLGIEFRRYPYGVVLGFLVSSIGPLVSYLAVSVFGTQWLPFARYASPVSYILSLAIWLSTFGFPEIEEREWTHPMSPDQMLEEVKGYLKVLGVRHEDDER